MAHAIEEVGLVTDVELVRRLEHLVKVDRVLGVKLLVHLGELNERRLFLERGYSSIYEYCKGALGMSGDEAYFRVRAAKVGRQFPLVLERLGAGAVHLSGVNLLAPFFTNENHAMLLARAEGKTKKQIEVLVAEVAPRSDAPARLRRLPTKCARKEPASPLQSLVAPPSAEPMSPLAAAKKPPTVALSLSEAPVVAAAPSTFALQSPAASVVAAAPFVLQLPPNRACTKPLSPGRFKLEVTLGQEAHDRLEQLQELLRHQNPSGDLAKIVERALTELLEREMKRRFAQTSTPKRRVACESDRSGTGSRAAVRQSACEPVRSEPPVPAPVERVSLESARSGRRAAVECRAGAALGEPQRSRYIPREVVRQVFARDAGQCTFVSPDGHRCAARGFLELHHHETTFAHGGAATPANLRLACRAHNFFLAEQEYGREFMQQRLTAAGH